MYLVLQKESAPRTERDHLSASAPVRYASGLDKEEIAPVVEENPQVLLLPDVLFPDLRLNITSIKWERVWVTLTLEFSESPLGEVDFVIYDTLRAFPVDIEQIDERTYVMRINVTNFRDRHQLPNGTWRFLSVIDGQRGPLASYPLAQADQLAASGRSYLYNRNLSTYVITFGLTQDDRADVVMRSYQLNRPTPKKKGR